MNVRLIPYFINYAKIQTQVFFRFTQARTHSISGLKSRVLKLTYHKVSSSNTSRLEPHPGFDRLLMKGIFDAYVLWPFDKRYVLNYLVTHFNTWNFTVMIVYTLISSNLMYPHNGKVMTKPKTLPIKLLDINEFLSSKGTHRAIMACKAGKVTPSNIPWKTLRTIKAQTFHLATTGLKKSLVICYQNCSDLLWEKIVLVIEKNFWNSRLKAENLQNFWDH